MLCKYTFKFDLLDSNIILNDIPDEFSWKGLIQKLLYLEYCFVGNKCLAIFNH